VQSGNALLIALFFAIIVIFLVLAAQFESWRDPLVILLSVPLAFSGHWRQYSWAPPASTFTPRWAC